MIVDISDTFIGLMKFIKKYILEEKVPILKLMQAFDVTLVRHGENERIQILQYEASAYSKYYLHLN